MRSLITTNGTGAALEPQATTYADGLTWAPDRLFNRLLGNAWNTDLASGQSSGGMPIEILELDDTVRVVLEVPGIAPENLDISLRGQVLTIVGNKQPVTEDAGTSYSERRFGALRRSIKMPVPVDADSANAEHKHGVVTITFQKSESIRPKRIEISPS